MTRARELIVAAALAGCGYAPRHAVAPSGIHRVSVSVFSAAGLSPEVGAWVASDVARRLAAVEGVSLSTASRADARVQGHIGLAGDEAVALSAGAAGPVAVLGSLRLRVQARLVGRDGRALRTIGPLLVSVSRPIEAAPGADRTREDRALRDAADDAARRVVQGLFAGP